MRTARYISIFAAATVLLSSCLKEAYPSSGVIGSQIEGDASSIESQVNSIPASLFLFGDSYASCGYPGIMLLRDAMTADEPVYSNTYDYYGYYVGVTQYLGDYDLPNDLWRLYVKLNAKCNNVVQMCNPDELTPALAGYLGNALTFRAFSYLDMLRFWEYRTTGVSSLDARAESTGIMGLTVPIVTEKTTLAQARENPRAEFWKMYRFVLTDLNSAVKYLEGYSRSSYIYADQNVAYGLLARLWLEIGTRFDRNVEDMREALSHEDDTDISYDRLGVKDAAGAFAKAAEFAALAQNGHAPLTQEEWMNKKTGFNTPTSSWLWCMSIGTDDAAIHSWKSWIPEISPEVNYGVVLPLGAFRMIDAALYSTIPDSDWRKKTWISPSDAGKSSRASLYETNLDDATWATVPAYTGFKFRPAQGDMDTYTTGTAVSIPLMRTEEMALIEAEALAHSAGLGAGINALETFVRSYRDSEYKCSAGSMEQFTDEVFRQKRIELWGEGLIMWDYKRLAKGIKRGYTSPVASNHVASHQVNSPDGVVARWLNVYITSNEYQYNRALKQNPDPSYNSQYEY